jgi:hypothetical protein
MILKRYFLQINRSLIMASRGVLPSTKTKPRTQMNKIRHSRSHDDDLSIE